MDRLAFEQSAQSSGEDDDADHPAGRRTCACGFIPEQRCAEHTKSDQHEDDGSNGPVSGLPQCNQRGAEAYRRRERARRLPAFGAAVRCRAKVIAAKAAKTLKHPLTLPPSRPQVSHDRWRKDKEAADQPMGDADESVPRRPRALESHGNTPPVQGISTWRVLCRCSRMECPILRWQRWHN